MFVALWEVFLEGFCVVLAVGVVAVGVLVLVFLAVGVLASVVLVAVPVPVSSLVAVMALTVVIALAAAVVGVWPVIAAVVLNGPVVAGVLVAVPVPAVVVVLVVGVVPAVAVAVVSVLCWVCESGVVAELWGGEEVEGRSGVWVDGASGAGGGWGVWGVVGWVDEDVGEEDGVEEFLEAGRGVGVGVEAVAVFEEGEGFFEAVVDCLAVGGQGGEFSAGVVEFAGEAGLLGFEQVEGDGLGVVGLQECGLLGFERAGVGGEGVGVLAGVEAVEFAAQACCDGAPLVGGDADVMVEVGDGVVDVVDEDGFEGALVAVALAVGADEVWVDVAVSGFGVVDDEPAAALAAADGGFQVMVVDALAFAVAVLAEDGLDALPSGLVNEGLVRARVVNSLVGDDAAVIGVAQDVKELVVVEGMGRPAGRGGGGQAVSDEMVSEGRQRPTISGVLGESLSDQRAADRVDVDPAGLPALAVTALLVEVTERGPADGPAGTGFLTEAFDHLGGQVTRVELSDGGHDAVQEHAAGSLVNILTGGDQPHAGLVKRPIDLHIVGPVSRQPIQLVDNDIVNPPVLRQIGQHPLQPGTIDATSRLAASFSGRSTTSAPIVIAVPAMEAAFCSASLVTRTGSTTPAALRSISLPGVLTLIPKPGYAAFTCGRHSPALRPELVSRMRNGCSSA